jgi:rRNA maturation endonuclease Nob1
MEFTNNNIKNNTTNGYRCTKCGNVINRETPPPLPLCEKCGNDTYTKEQYY